MTTEPVVLPIRFARLFVPLAWLTGMWPPYSRVTVRADAVQVTMGWAFRTTLPLAGIASARAVPSSPWWWGIGVHGFRGTWAVNGSRHGAVELCLDPPQRGRVLGVPVRLRRLYVSLTDPDALVDALQPARA